MCEPFFQCRVSLYTARAQAHILLPPATMTITLEKLRLRWLQARIAYHRRQADSYNLRVVRSYRRERYHAWLQNMRLQHSMKAHALERQLSLSGGRLSAG
jgi:hypothetical protein